MRAVLPFVVGGVLGLLLFLAVVGAVEIACRISDHVRARRAKPHGAEHLIDVPGGGVITLTGWSDEDAVHLADRWNGELRPKVEPGAGEGR